MTKKTRSLRHLLAVALLVPLLGWMMSCSNDNDEEATVVLEPTTWHPTPSEHRVPVRADAPTAIERDVRGEPIVHRIPTHVPPGRLRTLFCDSNFLQLQAACAMGFRPIGDLSSTYAINRPVVPIRSCEAYLLDSLSMSMPYLVPEAAQLLYDIGIAFSDTIRARGGKDYRMRVTSLTRSDHSVSRLKRRNRAATTMSCHRYGTTFDISWVKFDCLDSAYVVSLEDLKNILAEIIWEKREQGRCYAIYERRQGCFHVTVRPQPKATKEET